MKVWIILFLMIFITILNSLAVQAINIPSPKPREEFPWWLVLIIIMFIIMIVYWKW